MTVAPVTLSSSRPRQAGVHESPEWVRISMASAIALRFRSGRFTRDFEFGGMNLLLNYEDGCRSDCGYCGLARTRPGTYEDKSFIRVEWPLVRTDELVDRMAARQDTMTRLCISMVTHPHAYRDTLEIASRITAKVRAPLSILVAPPTLNRTKMEAFQTAGVDMIGIGLDAVTEDLFRRIRTDVPAGGAGLSWAKYWEVVYDAREIFGPWKVNVHTLVGLGENDRDLIDIFCRMRDSQIFSYLFCFNPEPDSRMGEHPKSELRRWRRIQLAKHLIETDGFTAAQFDFDSDDNLTALEGDADVVERSIESGIPFMTNGCPGAGGEPGCTRPYGSYRPSEPIRDFPFVPNADDLAGIRSDLALHELTS
jgi:lipoyl synthase